ncbi:MAG: hypothetical protein Q4E75_00020 [bacterium]|nr:hypothetical protein [bacterium]
MDYNDKIKESKKHLSDLNFIYKKIVDLVKLKDSKNKKNYEKQNALFYKYIENDRTHNTGKYNKKTSSNLKNSKYYIQSDFIDELRSNLEKFKLQYSPILEGLEHKTINEALSKITSEYNSTLSNISSYENMMKNDAKRKAEQSENLKIQERKKMEEANKPTYEKQELIDLQGEIESKADRLMAGPKRRSIMDSLSGIDKNINDMEYLYGFSIDILLLMEKDQHVEISNIDYDNPKFNNVYLGNNSNQTFIRDTIFKKYGVSNIDGLLKKYSQIRENYFKRFEKLSASQKEKYSIENVGMTKSSFNDGSIVEKVFKTEKFGFPTTTDKMIDMVNSRILNGSSYDYVYPRVEDKKALFDFDYKEYDDVYNYYSNLIKNMNIEQVKQLYKKVYNDIVDRSIYGDKTIQNELDQELAIIQKMFCELIFNKLDKKYADVKQEDKVLIDIAKNYLNEDIKFPTQEKKEVSEKEKKERERTVAEEYIIYLSSLDDKSKAMNYNEFTKEKYGLNNLEIPEEYEEKIKKGVR